METVTFNEGLEKIDVSAFTKCEGLTAAILPDSLTELGERAFYQCTALKTVKIGTGLSDIKNETFDQCTSLSSLTLSEGLKTIGNYAFRYTSIEMIYLPDSVTEIGGYAFANNKALFFARLGPNVTTAGSGLFSMCSYIRLYQLFQLYQQFLNTHVWYFQKHLIQNLSLYLHQSLQLQTLHHL